MLPSFFIALLSLFLGANFVAGLPSAARENTAVASTAATATETTTEADKVSTAVPPAQVAAVRPFGYGYADTLSLSQARRITGQDANCALSFSLFFPPPIAVATEVTAVTEGETCSLLSSSLLYSAM
ncbi:hypothetical protein BDZ88DRAFT_178918 [Geranomyces variabilis]|nr:hypothetical protein BDZ88DRAFT_178918 [Geranomyces variabilis]